MINACVHDAVRALVLRFRENALGAHDITYTGHYEKSLCSDSDPYRNDENNLLGLDRPITQVNNITTFFKTDFFCV